MMLRNEKRGFTLVEMLIVVAVIVTLMTLVFKLGSIGGDSYRRNVTVTRLQRVENCLSGYNAAFGGYPPVKLHGTRDIYQAVDIRGMQSTDAGQRNEAIWSWLSADGESVSNADAESKAWKQVRAACLAQPVATKFPFQKRYANFIRSLSATLRKLASSGDKRYKSYAENKALQTGFDDGFSSNPGRFSKHRNDKDWRNVQLFKFGLMSYLLPRYLVMIDPDDQDKETLYENFEQWGGNNSMPCDPFDGESMGGWLDVRDNLKSTGSKTDYARVANMPTQAVCARWMPNLEQICTCNHSTPLFGVEIYNPDWSTGGGSELNVNNADIEVFSPDGWGAQSDQYILDSVTVKDGWAQEFYYYSPPPYQTYVLWSGGPNRRTFPPWVSREGLNAQANRCVSYWIKDDIRQLSH